MLVLVDIDDVCADFHEGFLARWRIMHPEKSCAAQEQQTEFYIHNNFPREYEPLVWEIKEAPGFYRSLPLIAGSKGGVEDIARRHDVFFCSSPMYPKYNNCVTEKYEWIEEHFGNEWTKRVILTNDKTVVKGNILIDDKPDIHGVAVPEWEQVLYDQPYNRKITGKRRMTWDNWKDVLQELA